MKVLAIQLLVLTLNHVGAYTWGVEKTACKFFTPSHIGRNRRPADNYYKLSSEKVIFSPGETIEIKVTGSSTKDSYSYTGLLMSVRKDGESYGTWEESFDFRHIDCDNKLGSAIADANIFPKIVGADVFKWTAPDECEFNEVYYVSATVVKSKREFLDGLKFPLKCVQASKNKETDSCSRQFYSIPDGSTTSFEPGNSGNWTSYNNAKMQWKLMKGPTPSPGTGPLAAFDGEYYMYMESSFPARRGHRAILVSPPGLGGCLCFRFAYHMYTDVEAKFYCTVNTKPVQCQHPNFRSDPATSVPMDTRRDRWINSWLSINEPGRVEIKMIGQRGVTFRGDIALDKFVFTAGMCKEDEKAEIGSSVLLF